MNSLLTKPVLSASLSVANALDKVGLGGGGRGPSLAPHPQGATTAMTTLAQNIQDLLLQAVIIAGPVLIAAGFAMIVFGGINPQWKQRGIETIKWTAIGAIGMLIGVAAIWAFIQSAGGGGGGGTP